VTPHVLIHCEACGLPILLHAGTLQQPFADPDELPNDTSAIGAACPYCKNLRRYFLHQIQGRSSLGPAVVAETPDEETVHVCTLSCGIEDCEFLIPLFALWNVSTTVEERTADAETWRWENLLCPEGHSIPKPALRWDSDG
jgi:hypothetical protein